MFGPVLFVHRSEHRCEQHRKKKSQPRALTVRNPTRSTVGIFPLAEDCFDGVPLGALLRPVCGAVSSSLLTSSVSLTHAVMPCITPPKKPALVVVVVVDAGVLA